MCIEVKQDHLEWAAFMTNSRGLVAERNVCISRVEHFIVKSYIGVIKRYTLLIRCPYSIFRTSKNAKIEGLNRQIKHILLACGAYGPLP